MFRIFYASKDTTLYERYANYNTGLDEILEVGGYTDISGEGETSRILIQFSSTEIADIVTNKIGSNNYSASLGLYLADAYQIPVSTTIFAYPVYSPIGWDNGSGKYGDVPVNDTGVSWAARKYGGANAWPTAGLPAGVTYYTTGSKPGGGTWYTASGATNLEFTQSNPINSTYDVYMDVTNAVKLWNSGSIDNNGFILKLSSSLESNTHLS